MQNKTTEDLLVKKQLKTLATNAADRAQILKDQIDKNSKNVETSIVDGIDRLYVGDGTDICELIDLLIDPLIYELLAPHQRQATSGNSSPALQRSRTNTNTGELTSHEIDVLRLID